MDSVSVSAVNIRCYADPQKGLSCGVELPDAQCKGSKCSPYSYIPRVERKTIVTQTYF